MANEAKVPRGIIEVREYAWDPDVRPVAPIAGSKLPRNDPQARRSSVIAGLALLVGACIVIAVAVWSRRATLQEAAVTLRESTTRAPAVPTHPITAPHLPPPVVAATGALPVMRPAVSAAESDPAAAERPTEKLPITVVVNRGMRMIRGRVVSLSGNPLVVMIRAVNEGTRKSAEMYLNLEPFEQKFFTSEELDMSPGDHLIFHSPQFLDQSVLVE